jgi:methionine sulfoxide reductase catalytic subunit
MPTKRGRGWEMQEREATPEAMFRDRRRLIQAMGLGAIAAAAVPGFGRAAAAAAATAADDPQAADPTASLYPAKRNERYALDRPVTAEEYVTIYNNFYEFGSQKDISGAAQALPIRPWTIKFDGLVEKEKSIDFDDLVRQMPLEERLYRHRCVEAWSMAVPWNGFPMKALVDFAKPLGSAKYVRMESFSDARVAPGQKQFWYPWPYVEGLTMAEATNELAFIVTGAYGKPLPRQNGAPLRLATPWKYGFKSTKSIVRFTFAEARPVSFWEKLQSTEYGFWANINPDVPHPRWSQASERVLGTGERRPTLIWNGYGEFVADMYKGLEKERLFA